MLLRGIHICKAWFDINNQHDLNRTTHICVTNGCISVSTSDESMDYQCSNPEHCTSLSSSQAGGSISASIDIFIIFITVAPLT